MNPCKNKHDIIVSLLMAFTMAVSLSVPNGYSIAPFFLFLLSPSLFFLKPVTLSKEDKSLVFLLLLYGLGMFFFVYIDGWHVRELDRPSRFFFVVPILLMLLRQDINNKVLFYGVMLGAGSAFIVACYEYFYLYLHRAQGGVNPIMFGNIALLLGLLSFVFSIWAYANKNKTVLIISVLSGMSGVMASMLSGSRGGWIGLPILITFILWYSKDLFGRKLTVIISACIIVLMVIILSISQFGVSARINLAVSHVSDYLHGDNKASSIGERFELWKASYYLFLDSPVLGVGEYGGMLAKKELVEQGLVHKSVAGYSHAHNEYIDALSLRGIVGLLLLISIYIVPFYLFFKKIKKYPHNWDIKSCALAGALVPLCYMDFALTQSMFSHHIGVIMYICPIIYFWAALRSIERRQRV